MNNKEFAVSMEKRTLEFAFSIIELSKSIPGSIEARVVKNQLIKSATSIGANYREANRSRSKPDFINKIRICEFEASETVYWLEIIACSYHMDSEKVKALLSDSRELLAIFTSIGKSLRRKQL